MTISEISQRSWFYYILKDMTGPEFYREIENLIIRKNSLFLQGTLKQKLVLLSRYFDAAEL